MQFPPFMEAIKADYTTDLDTGPIFRDWQFNLWNDFTHNEVRGIRCQMEMGVSIGLFVDFAYSPNNFRSRILECARGYLLHSNLIECFGHKSIHAAFSFLLFF